MVADEGLHDLTMIIMLNFTVCQLVKVYKTAITLPEELLCNKRTKSPQIVLRCFEYRKMLFAFPSLQLLKRLNSFPTNKSYVSFRYGSFIYGQ